MATLTHARCSTAALRSISRNRTATSTTARQASTANSKSGTNASTEDNNAKDSKTAATDSQHNDTKGKPKKSVLQQDEELRQKMSGLSGDGGESGVEYEDGQPVSMKRSVKNNMFRYI